MAKFDFGKLRRINLGISFLIIVLLVVLAYFLFGLRTVGKGPEILINVPQEGVVVYSPIVEIEGKVKNVADMRINGSEVFLQNGDTITEKLILQPGENEFEFVAKDKFGNETRKTIKLIYKENK